MSAEEPGFLNGPPIRPPNREWLEEKLGFPLEEHALKKFLAEKKKERLEQAAAASAPSSEETTPEKMGRKLMQVRQQLPSPTGLPPRSAEEHPVSDAGLALAVLPAEIASQPVFPNDSQQGEGDETQVSDVPPLTGGSNDLLKEGNADNELHTPIKSNARVIEVPSPTTAAT